MAACPSAADLLALLDETLPSEQGDSIIAHLEQCRDCEGRLNELTRADPTLIGTVRRAASLPRAEAEGELECGLAVQDAGRLGARLSAAGSTTIFMAGHVIGPYRLVRLIGQGGMGTVYEAVHSQLEKRVALKVIQERLLTRPDAVDRFQREMRAIGRLSHPSLVTAFDAGQANGVHFLAMELVTGIDLSRLITRSKPMPIGEACELMRQTALALAYIHQHGLIHRDVKPANLMRTRDGQIKILDLGLARIAEDSRGSQLTEPGQFVGTLDYIAPEQAANGQSADHRADLYGLGATFYALLTGSAPFATNEGQTFVQQLDAVLHKTPTPVRDRRADVPEELSTYIDRLLAKSPDQRPNTATDAATFLDRYSSTADPVSAVTQRASVLFGVDRRAAAVSAAVILLCCAAGFSFFGFLGRHQIAAQRDQPAEAITSQAERTTQPPLLPDSPVSSSQISATLEIEDARVLLFRAGRASLFGQVGFSGNPLERLEATPEWPQVGDRVRLEVKLSRPAHCAVLIVNPDGTIAEYTRGDGAASQQFRVPVAGDRDYHLQEGAGALGIFLLCSDAAIPPARFKPMITAAIGWDEMRADAIWRFDGQRWLGRDSHRGDGPGEAPPESLTRLAETLRAMTGLSRALVLPVQTSGAADAR